MTGMTPPVFTLSGMCVLCAAVHPPADHAPRVLHDHSPCRPLDEHDGAR